MRGRDQRADCRKADEAGHRSQQGSRAHFFESLKSLPRAFGNFRASALAERNQQNNRSTLCADECSAEETHPKNQERTNRESGKDYVSPVRGKFPVIVAHVAEKHHSRAERTVLADDGD